MNHSKSDPSTARPNNDSFWVVASLSLGGLLLRLLFLGSKSLWLDEVWAMRVMNLGQTVLWAGGGEPYHPPLFYLLLEWWSKLGNSEAILRLMSVIPAVLAIPLMYLVGKSSLSREIGLTSAALLAFSPLSVWYSQDIRPYTLLACLSLLVVLSGVRLLEKPNVRWWLMLLAGLTASLYLHYTAVLLFPLLLLLFGAFIALRRTTWHSFWAVVAAGVVSMATFWPWLQTPNGARLMTLIDADNNYVAKLLKSRLSFLPFADHAYTYLLAAVVVGVLLSPILSSYMARRLAGNRAFERLPENLLVQTATIAIFVAGLVLSVWPRGYTIKRQIVFLWPYGLLFFAWVWPWRLQTRNTLVGVLTLSLVASLINVTCIKKTEWRELNQFIIEQQNDDDIVLLEPRYLVDVFNYYNQDRTKQQGLRYQTAPPDMEQLKEENGRIWFIVHGGISDPERHYVRWLDANTNLVRTIEFYGLEARLYLTGY